MALKESHPPAKCVDVVLEALARLSTGLDEIIADFDLSQLSLAAPHLVYLLECDNSPMGSLDAATKTGWRYLVLQRGSVVAAAEVELQRQGTVMQFAGINVGPYVDGFLRAVAAAEQSEPGQQKAGYKVRWLTMPTVRAMALWLHRRQDEWLIPVPPTFQRYEAYVLYRPEELFELLARPVNEDFMLELECVQV